MTILLVEDQLDVLDCLRSYFSDKGFDVLTACTAQEAISLLDRIEVNMVFTDLVLPRGDGRMVVQEIAKRGLPTRMVVITGCDDLKLRQELLSLGVTDYLFKPIALSDLNALLKPLLHPAPSVEPVPGSEEDLSEEEPLLGQEELGT